MDKNKIIKECNNLYFDIDSCIDDLIKARISHDTEAEGKALFRMEGLMVGTQQLLSWVVEQLSEKELTAQLDKAAEEQENREFFTRADDFKSGAEWAFGQLQKIENPKPIDWWMDKDGNEYCHGYESDEILPWPVEVYVKQK